MILFSIVSVVDVLGVLPVGWMKNSIVLIPLPLLIKKMFVRSFICSLSLSLSACLPACLPVCLSVCLSLSLSQ